MSKTFDVMSEEERYTRIADLLRRRRSQREYAEDHRRRAAASVEKAAHHVNIIRELERELLQLGYPGY